MDTIANIYISLTSRLRAPEEGQSLIEWTLILGLISLVAIAILGVIGTNLVTKLTDIATQI